MVNILQIKLPTSKQIARSKSNMKFLHSVRVWRMKQI